MLIGIGSMTALMGASAPAVSALPMNMVSSPRAQDSDTLRQGIPGRRLGGGTRSDRIFAEDYAYLAALVTPDNLGITTATYPELLFYVPEMVNAHSAEFVLRDSDDRLVYETQFQLEQSGGIVSVGAAGSGNMMPLALDQNYRWYFSIVPNTTDRANDVVVHGGIRRVDQTAWLAQNALDVEGFAQLDPLSQAQLLYQHAGLWHDAALILDELRQRSPEDEAVATEWSKLLEAADLSAVVPTKPDHIRIGFG